MNKTNKQIEEMEKSIISLDSHIAKILMKYLRCHRRMYGLAVPATEYGVSKPDDYFWTLPRAIKAIEDILRQEKERAVLNALEWAKSASVWNIEQRIKELESEEKK